jgi:3-oxoacyl-[acyl-carrier-protein] synthase II
LRAVVTGMGAVTALGRGIPALWSAMAAGDDGIRPIQRFATAGFDAVLGGVIADRNRPGTGDAPLCIELGIDAAREAWAAAGLAALPSERIALVVGSSLGDEQVPLHRVTEAIGDAVGALGPRLTISTACTSSTNALGLALDLLEQGAADAVLAGGADVLTPLVHAGFHALGVLSTGKCAPFSRPTGTTLGEGAGFVVLERAASARSRGARTDLAVLGYGLSADAYHETGPDPSGASVARALRGALVHAGIPCDAIGYVNAHGTGTIAGDPAEWRALRHVLGERAASVPVS